MKNPSRELRYHRRHRWPFARTLRGIVQDALYQGKPSGIRRTIKQLVDNQEFWAKAEEYKKQLAAYNRASRDLDK